MRLPFRKPEPNPWILDDHPPPPIGMGPITDLYAMQHSILYCLWEVCRAHESYSRTLMLQSAAIIVISLVNVYWAGRYVGWW